MRRCTPPCRETPLRNTRRANVYEKKPRYEKIAEVKRAAKEHFSAAFPDKGEYISACVDGRVKDIMRAIIVDEGVRVDGRAMDELRPISCETCQRSLLHSVHNTFENGGHKACVDGAAHD